MLSAANLSIVTRDRELKGLGVLLDCQATVGALQNCGFDGYGPLQIEYIRYKPGRRCISLVRFPDAAQEQLFVLTAFSEMHFAKQAVRTKDSTCSRRCWQNEQQRIRIDRFPFDPTLKHIAKCFDPSDRRRLLRRVMGREIQQQHIKLETLAYKPCRRYVAVSQLLANAEAPANAESWNTFKFYSGSQFGPTLSRLRGLRTAGVRSPNLIFCNEHYGVLVMEWVQGLLLADMIESGLADDSLLLEVGCELARLHKSPAPQNASSAAGAHELMEIAEFVGFLCPELGKLASQVVNATNTHLYETRQQRTIIHGDFYAKQVISQQGAVRFIDFDQAGLGNPYQDIGNFVAKLYWQYLCLNQDLSQVGPMVISFLAGYCSVIGAFDDLTYRAHLAAGLIRCATHPFRRAQNDWSGGTRQLLLLAQLVLHSKKSNSHSVSIA